METILVLSRTRCVITYTNCLIIWEIRLQTENLISTTEAEYIVLYQAIGDDLTFVILMEEIELLLKLQR